MTDLVSTYTSRFVSIDVTIAHLQHGQIDTTSLANTCMHSSLTFGAMLLQACHR